MVLLSLTTAIDDDDDDDDDYYHFFFFRPLPRALLYSLDAEPRVVALTVQVVAESPPPVKSRQELCKKLPRMHQRDGLLIRNLGLQV